MRKALAVLAFLVATHALADAQQRIDQGIALADAGKYDEARKLLKKELQSSPNHSSGRFALAGVFEAQRFRAPAILEYLRFLSLEPSGARAKEAAGRVVALLNLGVEVKDKKNINITFDPNSRKEEGDYSTWEFMMSMAGAVRATPENKKLSEFERTRAQLASTLSMFAEAPQNGSDYTAQNNIPFFVTLYEKELIDPFAAVALMPLNLPGQGDWLKKNSAKILAYQEYLAEKK